jgi:fermentation-respiration switch protein FrsA (DUF1100 family)
MLAPTPLLMVHGSGDQAVPVSDAREAYDIAGEPKSFVLVDTHDHVEINDREDSVSHAVDAAVAWFGKHL